VPWQGYRGDAVRIWRAQRDIIAKVMRGQVTPAAGLEELARETRAMM
jgi:multiple sugar transport system substrate-binding protein